jgi:hypothetical protein
LSTLAPRPRRLLQRLLDEPALVARVQELPPRALGRLIDHLGLEDAGELIALATTEQLARIFDDDLWRSARAGGDERFDPARFTRWLEVMLEAGDAFVADRLTELPEELVTLALARSLLVADLDALVAEISDDDESVQLEKALESALSQEFDQYRVIARRHDGWDAWVAALCALDQRHPAFFARLLERCAFASASYVEENGGWQRVLSDDEMLEEDAAAEREDRRAREGYISPAQARAFLAGAKQAPLDELLAARTRDPITRAYFREYAPAPMPAANSDPLVEALAQLDDEPPSPTRARLPASERAADTRFESALAELRQRDERAWDERMAELSYLANVLIAGHAIDGRAPRPREAAELALATCKRGLSRLSGDPVEILAQRGCDLLFRIGWR